MAKVKMSSLSSNMAKRKSIGMANLMDAAPIAAANAAHTAKKRTRARKRKSKMMALAPTDAVERVPTTPSSEVKVEVESGAPLTITIPDVLVEKDRGAQLRSPELALSGLPTSPSAVDGDLAFPTSPSGPMSAADLFDAIANDEFFEMISNHGIELCGTDEEATSSEQSAHSKTKEQDQPCLVINVNSFQDPAHGKTLLHQACKVANVQVVKCLLFHGASALQQCTMGRSPFHDIVSSGRREQALVILKTLYEYEPRGIALVDINGTHIVHLAAIHGCLDVVQWCTSLAGAAPVPMHMAITSFSGRNVLHYAAYNGRLNVLEWLLQESVQDDPVCGLSIASLDCNGYSVLHYAAMGGHLDICQWLVFHAPSRGELHILGTNSDGQTAYDMARQPEIQAFLDEVSQVPVAPCEVECIGADCSSIGITWKLEVSTEDPLLKEVLAPKWFALEYCQKPSGFRRASAMLAMLMLPSGTGSSSGGSASSYLLDWQRLDVLIQPDAEEYWLSGLDSDCDYLVRMRVFNRNGYSEFSTPRLNGEFRTAASPGGASRSGLRGLVATISSPSVAETSFIGTLDLELLEARRLLLSHSDLKTATSRRDAADQGRFFGVISLHVPIGVGADSTAKRRPSLTWEQMSPRAVPQVELQKMRCLYRMRTEDASVQQDLLMAGSLHTFRHPSFSLRTKLRVPEALDAVLSIQIHHETRAAKSDVVGVVHVSMMDFIRGFPAKLQWIALDECIASESIPCKRSRPRGEVLLRSLFLADGIDQLPHPTKPDMYCSSAAELLDDRIEVPIGGDRVPITGVSNVSSSPLSPTSPPGDPTTQKYDPLGFRLFREKEYSHKTYGYYRHFHQCMAKQQDVLWSQFHRELSTDSAIEKTVNTIQFRNMLTREREAVLYEPSEFRNSSRLRRLVWDGVPPTCRRVMYMRMSGAETKRRAAVKGYFSEQLKRVTSMKASGLDRDVPTSPHSNAGFESARKQIQVDLQRTFAGNMCWINTPDGQVAMERVLLAYAVHNQQIGYCQSMSFIVGRLLCLFHEQQSDQESTERLEEDVFWLLAALCEDYFPKFYVKGMQGLHVDALVLETLLHKRLPKVIRHFQVVLHNPPQMGLLLVTGWLLPVFCAVFPSETSFRLLDILIYERSSVVFALVIALLRMAQPQLIAETKDYMQVFRVLKERDQRLHDTALLMEIAHDEHTLLEREIESLRKQFERQLEEKQRVKQATTDAPTSP